MLVVAGLVVLVAVVVAVADGRASAAAADSRHQSPLSATPTATSAPAKLQRFRSPMPAVADEAWTRYVRLTATGRPASVSPGGHLGIFGLGLRRLEDLGFVRGSRKVERDGRQVWEADWVPPYTLDGFLRNDSLQYRAFVRHTLDHRARILDRHGQAIGQTYAAKVATLSGLLAVAHQAGLQGLARWLKDDGDRQRFPNTTAAFIRASGIF